MDITPAGNWALIGSSGDENYHEDGVSITVGQEIVTWTPFGLSLPLEAFRTNESIVVGVRIADLTLEEMRHAFNQATVTTDAGPPAISSIPLYRGPGKLAEMALLIRGTGKSPYAAAVNIQWEINRAVHTNAPEFLFSKAEPVAPTLEFTVLYDQTNATAGRWVEQTA